MLQPDFMKGYDVKHILYHVLVAIYLIWFAVFAILLAFTLNSYFNEIDIRLTKVLLTWIVLNLFMGTSLVVVIRLFTQQSLLSKIIVYSYFLMATASIGTMIVLVL